MHWNCHTKVVGLPESQLTRNVFDAHSKPCTPANEVDRERLHKKEGGTTASSKNVVCNNFGFATLWLVGESARFEFDRHGFVEEGGKKAASCKNNNNRRHSLRVIIVLRNTFLCTH